VETVALAAQALGVPLGQSPCAVTLVLATKLLALRRIVAGRGPIAHSGQLSRGEHLHLPHGKIVPQSRENHATRSLIDHAKIEINANPDRPDAQRSMSTRAPRRSRAEKDPD
jgi:hypothetical protein